MRAVTFSFLIVLIRIFIVVKNCLFLAGSLRNGFGYSLIRAHECHPLLIHIPTTGLLKSMPALKAGATLARSLLFLSKGEQVTVETLLFNVRIFAAFLVQSCLEGLR